MAAALKRIEQQARRGDTTPAPTDAQAARQRLSAATAAAAAQRQATQQRHMAAVSLPYRVAATQKMLIDAPSSFFDRMGKAVRGGRPAMDLYRAAGGRIPQAARTASSIMGAVMDVAEANPAAAALMAGAYAGAKVYAPVNEAQTAFQRQTTALASAMVGEPTLGNQRTLMGLQVADIATNLSIGQDQAREMIQSLADAGARRGDLLTNLKNVAAVSGPNQLPAGDVTQVVAALGTAGGQNAGQTNRTLQDMQNTARDAHISLTELLASMKALSSTAIGAAKDVGGLSAVQATIGASSGINAGTFLQPALSATGGQAFQAAGLLGLSTDQLLHAQTSKGGAALIYDRIAGFVRRVGHGPNATAAAEAALSGSGLVNASALSPGQYASLIHGMQTETPGQAERLAKQLYTQADQKAVPMDQSFRNAAQAMQDLTPATQRFSNWLQNITTHVLNSGPSAPPDRALPGMTLKATQAYARLDPLDYARQAAAGAPGAPGAPGGGTGYTCGPGMEFAQQQGVAIPNIKGSLNYATPDIVRADLMAANRNHVNAATLLAMQSQESSFQAGAISKDGGYGLAQFTNATVARKYLHVKPGQDWHAAALDPMRAAEGQAEYLAALLTQTHGNEQQALARYNGSAAYGAAIEQRAQQAADRLDVHVDVTVHDQNGQRLPSTVNHQRTVTGSRSHYAPPAHRPGPR